MTEPSKAIAPVPPPQGGFKQKLKHYILHPELSTQQVAWSFAIGFAMCWNPLLGLHTGLILLLCFCFRRLHLPLMLLAAFINNPWTLVPIATASAYTGNLLLGRGFELNLGIIRWHEIGLRSFTSRAGFEAMSKMVEPILAPYLLGGFVLMALALPVGYFAMLKITRKLRSMHLHVPHIHMPHVHHSGSKQGD